MEHKLLLSIDLLNNRVKLGKKQSVFVSVSQYGGQLIAGATVKCKVTCRPYSSEMINVTDSKGRISFSWACDSICGKYNVSINAESQELSKYGSGRSSFVVY